MLREYLNTYLKNGFIRSLRSPAALPVLFILKTNKEFRLYVNYKGLNVVTIKNRYLFLFINEIFNRVSGAKIFTKINIKIIYYRVRIRDGDE